MASLHHKHYTSHGYQTNYLNWKNKKLKILSKNNTITSDTDAIIKSYNRDCYMNNDNHTKVKSKYTHTHNGKKMALSNYTPTVAGNYRWPTTVCQNFARDGVCQYGDKCHLKHINEQKTEDHRIEPIGWKWKRFTRFEETYGDSLASIRVNESHKHIILALASSIKDIIQTKMSNNFDQELKFYTTMLVDYINLVSDNLDARHQVLFLAQGMVSLAIKHSYKEKYGSKLDINILKAMNTNYKPSNNGNIDKNESKTDDHQQQQSAKQQTVAEYIIPYLENIGLDAYLLSNAVAIYTLYFRSANHEKNSDVSLEEILEALTRLICLVPWIISSILSEIEKSKVNTNNNNLHLYCCTNTSTAVENF